MSSISNMLNIRVGNGFDVHRFCNGRPLVLGGVELDHSMGLLGHSDADVLIHSIMDSFLGPAGLPDIGQLFPDTDPEYSGISSILLLERVYEILKERKITVINTDSVILCEKPKIAPYIESMKNKISQSFMNELPPDRIGIKATTTEKLGFTGREEGIAVYTVSLLQIDN